MVGDSNKVLRKDLVKELNSRISTVLKPKWASVRCQCLTSKFAWSSSSKIDFRRQIASWPRSRWTTFSPTRRLRVESIPTLKISVSSLVWCNFCTRRCWRRRWVSTYTNHLSICRLLSKKPYIHFRFFMCHGKRVNTSKEPLVLEFLFISIVGLTNDFVNKSFFPPSSFMSSSKSIAEICPRIQR